MAIRRTLTLKRETLTELSTDDLRAIVGADTTTALGVTTPAKYCITDLLTCYNTCASWHTEQC